MQSTRCCQQPPATQAGSGAGGEEERAFPLPLASPEEEVWLFHKKQTNLQRSQVYVKEEAKALAGFAVQKLLISRSCLCKGCTIASPLPFAPKRDFGILKSKPVKGASPYFKVHCSQRVLHLPTSSSTLLKAMRRSTRVLARLTADWFYHCL